jgi:hypothetical protein
MKMLIVLLAVTLPSVAETFVFGESYRTFKKDAFQNEVIWAQQSLGKSAGLFAWGQTSTSYHLAYGGVYVKPASWLQVGGAVGAENVGTRERLAAFAYAAKAKYSAFAVYENGGSGYWYLATTDVAIWKRVSIGSHSQAFVGHGPRVEIKLGTIGKWMTSVRPAVTWDRESGVRPNVIVGLRFTYFKGD